MKIVHICISAPYIDNWGYQENLLPQYLAKSGIENYVIACAESFPEYLSSDIVDNIKKKGASYFCGDVSIKRIKTKMFTTTFVVPFKQYKALSEIKPDVIFHHGINSTSLLIASKYAKDNNVVLLVDNHADKFNISKNKLWRYLYHKIIIKYTLRYFCKNVSKYYGVTKGRCLFLQEQYGISPKQIDFLPIGADTAVANKLQTKEELRRKYNFSSDDFLVVSGGKMGVGKGTDKLLKAISLLNKQYPKIKLILFGRFDDKKTEISAKEESSVFLFGWCNREKTLELLKVSDLACWPVHHTTLIEDTISVGTPLLLKKTETTSHLIDENGFWIDENIMSVIENYYNDLKLQVKIHNGCLKMNANLSYDNIADKVIRDIKIFTNHAEEYDN